MKTCNQTKHILIIIIIFFFLHGLGRLSCSGNDALPSFPGASAIPSSLGFVGEGVTACFGSLVLSILSRWLIQFCLYLSLKSCISEISSSCLMSSHLILSSLVYPVTLLRAALLAITCPLSCRCSVSTS